MNLNWNIKTEYLLKYAKLKAEKKEFKYKRFSFYILKLTWSKIQINHKPSPATTINAVERRWANLFLKLYKAGLPLHKENVFLVFNKLQQ